MAVAIGTTATAVEVKARWAYCEIQSGRFGGYYVGRGPSRLLSLSQAGSPFSQVNPDDWPHLVAMLESARNKPFVDNIDKFGGASFKCVGWQVGDLFDSTVLPMLGRVRYPMFLTAKPNTLRGPGATFDQMDPRVAIWSIDPVEPFEQVEPIIVVAVERYEPMILEGYLRTLLWLRRNDANRPLLAWVPI